MLTARATVLDVGCGARVCSLLWDGSAVRHKCDGCGSRHDTRPRGCGETRFLACDGGGAAARPQNPVRASLSIANCGRRGRLIHEKIIGHGLRGLAASIAIYRGFFHPRVLALAHQPARQQRRGVLFQPGIQQLGDLLSQIGGMVQSREFVALQGIAGSGEQELPRGLSFVIQRDLQRELRQTIYINDSGNSTKYVRSVEKCEKSCLARRTWSARRSERRARS